MILFQLLHAATGERSEPSTVEGTLSDLAVELGRQRDEFLKLISQAEHSGAVVEGTGGDSGKPAELLVDKCRAALDAFLSSYVLVIFDNSRGLENVSILSLLEQNLKIASWVQDSSVLRNEKTDTE